LVTLLALQVVLAHLDVVFAEEHRPLKTQGRDPASVLDIRGRQLTDLLALPLNGCFMLYTLLAHV
jgi:hypothetical protein